MGNPLKLSQWLERRLDRFESSLARGKRPPIERYIEGCPDKARSSLFRSLLTLERSYRQLLGEEPSGEHYLQRFPDYVAEIRRVFSGGIDLPAAAQAVGPVPKGAKRFGDFELVRQLGRGAMGRVYEARQPALDRVVALKVISAGRFADEEERWRFEREAQAAAQLDHAGIVSVHETGEVDGAPYIASELVRGTTLRDVLRRRRPSIAETVKLLTQLADALHHAHGKGVIHRDLKPENIMIEPGGRPRLMDFGLARRQDAELLRTKTGQQLGTPAYMSPEQITGKSHQADARSDVWSLGVILYELLAGRIPFEAPIQRLPTAICEDDPIRPRRIERRVPRDLETICLKCLAKKPHQRYPSARHLADDLRAYAAIRPITARPTPAWERALKWTRRHPVLAAIAALVLLAIVALQIYAGTRPAYWDISVTPATANVRLDGQSVHLVDGRAVVPSRPGRFEYEVTAPGFTPRSGEVQLVRGRSRAAPTSVELRSTDGHITIDSEPAGAVVSLVDVNGQAAADGVTPFHSLPLPSGDYTLRLTRDAYKQHTETVHVPDGLATLNMPVIHLELAIENAPSIETLRELLNKLDEPLPEPLEIDYSSGDLEALVREVSQAFEFSIVIDRHQLRIAGITLNELPGFRVSYRTLRDFFGSLRIHLPDSDFMPTEVGGLGKKSFAFLITSADKEESTVTQVLHPVGDLTLAPRGFLGDTLRTLVMNYTAVTTWGRSGGPSRCTYLAEANCLLVQANWSAQFQIDTFLHELRDAQRANREFVTALIARQTADAEPIELGPALSPPEYRPHPLIVQTMPILEPYPTMPVEYNQHASARTAPLQSRPLETLIAEPVYASSRVLYGAIPLGHGEDNLISFAVDQAHWSADGRIYLDCNNDEDLTNDFDEVTSPAWPNSHPYRLSAMALVPIHTDDGRGFFNITILGHDTRSASVFYWGGGFRWGVLTIDDANYFYRLVDADFDGCFADIHDGLIMFDVNRDRTFETSSLTGALEVFGMHREIPVGDLLISVRRVSCSGQDVEFDWRYATEQSLFE